MWTAGSVRDFVLHALPEMAAPSLVPIPGASATPSLVGSPLMAHALVSPTILVFDSGLGGLTVVGGVVALGLWLFALHLVVIIGWLATQALDARLARRARDDAGRAGRSVPG